MIHEVNNMHDDHDCQACWFLDVFFIIYMSKDTFDFSQLISKSPLILNKDLSLSLIHI